MTPDMTSGNSRFTSRRTLLALCISSALGLSAPTVLAQGNHPANTDTTTETRSYSIPAQPLSEALIQFGQQSGLQITANSGLIDGKRASLVSGNMSAEQALDSLLAGTALGYKVNGGMVSLVVSDGTKILPKVIVNANSTQESAFGTVDGYAATRSATATKMDVALIDTPASIQVVPEIVIKDQGAASLKDVARNVSGVRFDSTAGNRSENFNIRGFSSTRLARDGFLSPASFGDSSFVGLSNLSRVEVLKGPASMLYGQVEPGGLINLVTKKPLEEAFGKLSGTYGSDDYKLIEADLNQPLSESGTLLGRLNTSYRHGGSFRDHSVSPEQLHIAPSLRWLPSEATIVDLQFEYSDQERAYDRGLVAKSADNLTLLPRERYLGESYSLVKSEDQRATLSIEHSFNSDWTLRASTQMTNSDHPIKAVNPASLRADGRTLNRNYQEVNWETENYGAQANLIGNLSIGETDHNLLIGADKNQT
ncbi:MAG TPA: TonB-dependent receptor, partial [Cellvibrio sp.]|nr:TonB-dependent receptor [Cellvibrio sp.]